MSVKKNDMIQLFKLFLQGLKYPRCAAGQIKADIALTGRIAMVLRAGGQAKINALFPAVRIRNQTVTRPQGGHGIVVMGSLLEIDS